MNIALDIPEDRRTIGAGRLCLLMGLTLLTIALTYSQPAGLDQGRGEIGAGEPYLSPAVPR